MSLEGKILVASPNVHSNYFAQSLIYICSHDEHGALGVILNHKIGMVSSLELKHYVAEILKIATVNAEVQTKKKKSRLASSSKSYPVVFGGPIYSDRVMVLGLTKEQEKNFDSAQSLTMYTDISSFLKDCVQGLKHSRLIFSKGVAAWDRDQLEEEIKENSWFVIPASLELLFSQNNKFKWRSVIGHIGMSPYCNFPNYSGQA